MKKMLCQLETEDKRPRMLVLSHERKCQHGSDESAGGQGTLKFKSHLRRREVNKTKEIQRALKRRHQKFSSSTLLSSSLYMIKWTHFRVPAAVQWVTDLALPQLWRRSRLWLGSIPGLRTCRGHRCGQKIGKSNKFYISSVHDLD